MDLLDIRYSKPPLSVFTPEGEETGIFGIDWSIWVRALWDCRAEGGTLVVYNQSECWVGIESRTEIITSDRKKESEMCRCFGVLQAFRNTGGVVQHWTVEVKRKLSFLRRAAGLSLKARGEEVRHPQGAWILRFYSWWRCRRDPELVGEIMCHNWGTDCTVAGWMLYGLRFRDRQLDIEIQSWERDKKTAVKCLFWK